MDLSIEAFVKSVSFKDLRILSTLNYVFLCGGPTGKDGLEVSARDHFYRYLAVNESGILKRVKLAETINNWFDDDTFPDLLELEEYLADLADVIVIFVESPGSIAELGAFAASDTLRPKTLAVLNSAHSFKRSFIADGPIRRIKKHDPNLVSYYDWNSADLTAPENELAFFDMDRDLTKIIKERKSTATREPKFSFASHGHIMLLIADLVDIIGITFGTELIDCLAYWNHKIDQKQLQKYLSLLEHLRLIKVKPNSNQTYLIGHAPQPLIKYSFIPGEAVRDRPRLKNLIRSSLDNNDARRMRIFRTHLMNSAKRAEVHV